METTAIHPVIADIAGIVGMSSGRLGATLAYAAALIGLVLGGLALRTARRARSEANTGAREGRGHPALAMALGVFGLIVGAVVVVTADGGVGSGNGRGGGIVAIALGLLSVALGGLARARAQEVV